MIPSFPLKERHRKLDRVFYPLLLAGMFLAIAGGFVAWSKHLGPWPVGYVPGWIVMVIAAIVAKRGHRRIRRDIDAHYARYNVEGVVFGPDGQIVQLPRRPLTGEEVARLENAYFKDQPPGP